MTENCKSQQEDQFRIGIHLLPGDNPQQAESTSSTTLDRESEEGYHTLFLVRSNIQHCLLKILLARKDTETQRYSRKN
jgi:hypothetical protein